MSRVLCLGSLLTLPLLLVLGAVPAQAEPWRVPIVDDVEAPATALETEPGAAALEGGVTSAPEPAAPAEPAAPDALDATPDATRVSAVFDDGRRAIDHCRKRVARDYGTQQGRLRLAVTIGVDGRVARIDVLENGASDRLASCIETVVGSWTFPALARPLTVERLWLFG